MRARPSEGSKVARGHASPRVAVVALVAALLASSAPGVAARAEEPSDEPLIKMMEAARDRIITGTYEDGTHVAPETEAERAEELLNPADGQRVLYAGFISGAMKWCGLDWTQSENAFLSAQRGALRWSPKQLAYMGVLHDVAMEAYLEEVGPAGACPDDTRDGLKEAADAGRYGW